MTKEDEQLAQALEYIETVEITEMPTLMGVPLDQFTKRELIKLLIKLRQENYL